eukprot:785823-Amphidinium_carterae.1
MCLCRKPFPARAAGSGSKDAVHRSIVKTAIAGWATSAGLPQFRAHESDFDCDLSSHRCQTSERIQTPQRIMTSDMY